ncbi:MAG: serine/threonine-protein kinase [Parcubacteria group bacterium]
MPKIVWIGNGNNKKSYDLNSLESTMKTGGQGHVYFPKSNICIKVLSEPDEFTDQLSAIGKVLFNSSRPYEQVKTVSAIPVELVWDEGVKRVIGYVMERLDDWINLSDIQTETDSESLGINLRSAGLILASLSRAIRLIHSQGFVVGDFNPSNILFKQEKDQFFVKVIDVDSWSIYRKDDLGIEYASKVLDIGTIYYPDIIQADREKKPWPNFRPDHDWWAFSYISWMILTKFDPFMTGRISGVSREDRILNGYTANSAAAVKLHPEYGPAAQALGPKLRFYLDRSLKRKVRRPFPTKVLEDFASNLRLCTKCNLTSHISAVMCPKCANFL